VFASVCLRQVSTRLAARVQEKMRTWSRQLEDLTSQVATLKMEKQELQQRNRILESSLTVNTHHEERLHCNEARRGHA